MTSLCLLRSSGSFMRRVQPPSPCISIVPCSAQPGSFRYVIADESGGVIERSRFAYAVVMGARFAAETRAAMLKPAFR